MEGKGYHWGKKVDWRKSGVKTLRRRMRIERNWMRRGKIQRYLREVEKLSCAKRGSGQAQKMTCNSGFWGGATEARGG